MKLRGNLPRVALTAGSIVAAIALSKCEPDTTIIRYQPDSGAAAEETVSRVARVNSVFEGKPCSTISDMALTKDAPQKLSSEISINLNDAILEGGKPVAFLTISGQGQNTLDTENDSRGVYTIHWSSMVNLKMSKGSFEQITMGQKGELLISLSVGAISVGGQSSSLLLDASICRNY
ncbi:MAG: hypothetical protein AABW86_04265 [Candidatus Micrarchaeota archaeon]